MQVFYCVSWPDLNKYTRSQMFTTSNAIEDFFLLCMKMDAKKFAQKVECFVLADVDGMSTNHYTSFYCFY